MCVNYFPKYPGKFTSSLSGAQYENAHKLIYPASCLHNFTNKQKNFTLKKGKKIDH